MRTTLTLDDDVAMALKETASQKGTSFKSAVNDTLRAGLEALKAPKSKRYRVKPASLGGVVPGIDLDKALRLAEVLEDEALSSQLEVRE